MGFNFSIISRGGVQMGGEVQLDICAGSYPKKIGSHIHLQKLQLPYAVQHSLPIYEDEDWSLLLPLQPYPPYDASAATAATISRPRYLHQHGQCRRGRGRLTISGRGCEVAAAGQ